MIHHFEAMVGGRILSLETGKIANQASGAVTVRYGDTVVLATAVSSKEPLEGRDFFPLTIDYEEKMYAAGKIPGGFIKREGRPTETAILTARMTDRPLRPLFPKGYRNEVQIINTVLSTDQENEPDILSIIGASAALGISDIPWGGPVGAVKVGYIDGEFVLNPTAFQLIDSQLELVIAGTKDAIIMMEGGASELPEELVLQAMQFGQAGLQETIRLQEKLMEVAGKPKQSFTPPAEDNSLQKEIEAYLGDRLAQAIFNPDKGTRQEAEEALEKEISAKFTAGVGEADLEKRQREINKAYETIVREIVRVSILEKGLRPDGRDLTTVRPISCEVGLLPRTHGSALFTRGQTQAISVTTLGTTREEQMLDGLGIEESKRYMHHYNFPPYSTGEVKRLRGPSRRDIGHGALAERALIPVLPEEDDFPYVLRVVSEIVSSNGSSSMASVCGSTLSLMDAGVPIKAPVSGVAMGLVTGEDGKYAVLTDIQGIEDHLGDMDLKIAGSPKGVTAIQMDIKTTGNSYEILTKAFEQARVGRMFILHRMLETISQSRPDLSPFAPRIVKIMINPEKIGAVIGPGGKVIRGIIEETGAKIDVEDDGSVYISSVDEESARKAISMVEGLTREAEVGQIYLGKVVRIMPYGAFVQILPGKDGLVHVSELADYHVQRVEDVLNIGDEISVMVTEIDRQGKVSLSRKAVLTGQMPKPKEARPGGPRPPYDRGPGAGRGEGRPR
jgi:polyribonucleotide nucleotidyltransferase